MALRAVPDHPKFADLKCRLNQPKGCVLGWLEAIWHFTGRFTPQGNIGKYEDRAIEAWVEWDGEPGALISALVAARWLDRDPTYRLLVHDWHIHADKAAKNAIMRSKLDFCVPTVRTVYPLPVPVPVPVPVPESSADPVPESCAAPAPANGIPHTPVEPAWDPSFSTNGEHAPIKPKRQKPEAALKSFLASHDLAKPQRRERRGGVGIHPPNAYELNLLRSEAKSPKSEIAAAAQALLQRYGEAS